MPSSIVKTKEDERLWDKAKDIAAEAGKKEQYDYIMGIYKKMNPDRFASLSPGFLLALRHAHEKSSSVSRYEDIFLATDGKWYLILGSNEHDGFEDSTAYGPFPSEDALNKYRRQFSNSGGGGYDDSGTTPPPTKSPNGGKLVKPTSSSGFGGGGYRGRWAGESIQADSDGIYMSVTSLEALETHARKLQEVINNDTSLPDWAEAKITRSNADLLDVYEFVEHGGLEREQARAATNWAAASAKRIAEAASWDWRPAAQFVENWINDSFSEMPTDVWMNVDPQGIPTLNFRMDYKSRYSEKWNQSKFRSLRKSLGKKFGLTPSATDESSYTLPAGQKVKIQIFIGGTPSGERLASGRVAAEPPLHLAAKADEAVGQAYRDLVSLKLGFDTWEEIPESVQPLYRWIGKAISSLVEARQMTTNVREIVNRKRF